MEQYISKDALVAEIERLRKNQRLDDRHSQGILDGIHAIEKFIDTLEVKEVDLDKEFDKYCNNLYLIDLENEPYEELFECAKHFFELGLKVQNQ